MKIFFAMPTIDTLDALGDATTTIWTKILTTNHAKDIPNKCPRYTTDMPKISKICAQIRPKKCPNLAKIMANISPRYALDTLDAKI